MLAQHIEETILRWDSTVIGKVKVPIIFDGKRFEIDQNLQVIDEIQRWRECATTPDDQSKANRASQIAMARLVDEFGIILSRLTILIRGINLGIDPESSFIWSSSITDTSTSYGDYDYYSEDCPKIKEAISDLRSIAERMNSAGHLHQCVEVYKCVRKSFLGARFRRLHIEKLCVNEVCRLEWKLLEAKIGHCIRATEICVRTLFPIEKRLCEQIFEGLGTGIADACFMEMVKDCAIQLFNFAEAVSTSRRQQPEKLFKISYMHNKLSDLLPEIDAVFQSRSLRFVFLQATGILPRIAEAARGILLEFENDLLHEVSNFLDHNGEIHHLTRYVVNYVIQISCFKETLTELIESMPSMEENMRDSGDLIIPDIEFPQFERPTTPLAVHLIWIIHILQFKLKVKSKCYDDTSLARLFMMNNYHYIVREIKGSPDLREIIGDDYLEKLAKNVQQVVNGYQTTTWNGIIQCLRVEGPNKSRKFSSRLKGLFRERLKTFNAMFEEVHRSQATWLVPDSKLREELRLSILEVLIPAYRSFLECIEMLSELEELIPPSRSFPGWIRMLVGSEKHRGILQCIKYSVEDLEIAVSDLFEGIPIHQYTSTRGNVRKESSGAVVLGNLVLWRSQH